MSNTQSNSINNDVQNMIKNINKKEEKSINIKTNIMKTPICTVLGNPDVGKTSLLDALRNTNLQEKEAGHITQSISGTNIQKKEIEYYFSKFKTKKTFDVTIPGILLIDTPGHESFVSLRQLGSNLCNIAIVVVEITKGPEKQTIESIRLLEESNVPYIIALNKVDTLYGWKSTPEAPFTISFKNQHQNTIDHFNKVTMQNFCMMAEHGVNAKLYTEIPNFKEWVPMVPISAKTKEGFSDLIAVLVKMTERFGEKVEENSETKGIVLEKYGNGEDISVILTNGKLKIKDEIFIRGLPLKIKGIHAFNHLTRKTEQLKEVNAAFCCSLMTSTNFDIIPGDQFSSVKQDYIEPEEELSQELLSDNGIFIQADSVGSLKALAYVLHQNNIPIKGYAIGPIRQKQVAYVMKNCQPSIILGFNVTVDKNTDISHIVIFTENIIFRLLDHYNKYIDNYTKQQKDQYKDKVVWPCVLEIEKGTVFRQKDPMIFAVKVTDGKLHLNTPLATFRGQEIISLGKVTSIRNTNDVNIDIAKCGQTVVIKVEGDSTISFGRHLTEDSTLYSHISRNSLDCLKEHFKDEINQEMLGLLVKLKKLLNVT